MISSMTGFARESGATQGVTWAWELKSVNGRGLDVRVRAPAGYEAIGEEARKAVSGVVSRGTVNLSLMVQRGGDAKAMPRINAEALAAAHRDAMALAGALGLSPPSMDALLQLRGVVEAAEPDTLPSAELTAGIGAGALKAASALAAARGALKAASALAAARREEGAALRRILEGQIDRVELLVRQVADHPARTPEAIRARLQEQVQALLDGANAPGFDHVRLHQEAALLATRADVREEIDRLMAHVAAVRSLLAEGGPIGRKLDFLAQEFGRESSTLCAKANHVELSRVGLELRTVIDQFREQVQNVE